MNDEYIIIVDNQDFVIARSLRSLAVQHFPKQFRVVNGLIEDAEGRVLILQRSRSLESFPGALDFSIGAFVKPGESYRDAFEREGREEVGLGPTQLEIREVGYETPRNGFSSFMKIYKVKAFREPMIDQSQFISQNWWSPTETLMRIQNGVAAKDDLAKVLIKYFL